VITPASIGLPPKFTSFRPEVKQEETILSLAASTTRFNILQAPPGVGKSIDSTSVGLLRGDRILYLTKSKSLQRQLHSDMSSIGLINIEGHSNYPCANVKYDPSGEMADLICEGRRKQNGQYCHYDDLVQRSLSSNFVSTNYAHWVQLLLSGNPDRLGKFSLLICDEAHNIASGSCLLGDLVSIKFFSSIISNLVDMRLPTFGSSSLDDYLGWAATTRHKANLEKDKLISRNGDYREVATLTRLIADLDRLNNESSIADFVILPIYQRNQVSGVQFKPTNIAHYTETYLYRGISSILLCSATIFREDSKLLGIPDDDCTFHEVSSSFSWKRRPFIYYPTTPPIKCDRSMGDGERRIWIDRLDLLMSTEPGKGIIQSRSYDRAEDILSRSKHHKQIIAYDRSTSREAIERFRKAPVPCTLIGPTIEEGEDFPGDLCSYVIWPKVPFLNVKDPFIFRMREKDKDYTNREVCRSIIQGSLRGMRFDLDFCRIWMIDKHWGHFRSQPYFFSWFRKAFMMIRGLNEMPREPKGR
jgi:ATP-dependent DNA helicase DinG